MKVLKTWRVAAVVILCAFIGVTAGADPGSRPPALEAGPSAQDVASLDRRINSLEQRLYAIESSLNRLERQAALTQRPPAPQASGRPVEVTLLSAEIEKLRSRLVEVECGLVKVDERTITPPAREARSRAGAARGTDPCRLNPEVPLRLSTRP